MKPVEIKKDVFWVGAVDWDIRDFHGYSTYQGTTYNAFLVKGRDKVALVDCVKKGFEGELWHRIHGLIDPTKVDYIVVNHAEPDHSGSLPHMIERCQPEKVFCSPMCEKALKAHYHREDWPLEVVKSGDSLDLGGKTLQFLETRMLHWPDSMFSYVPEDKLLISNDAFGLHWATSQRFDDQVDQGQLMEHAAKYYANILLLYSPLVQKLLAQVQKLGLEIDMIAPDHGVIWRADPGKIVSAYERWSHQVAEPKAVIVYDTMWHSTEQMAKAVGDGLNDMDVPVKLMNLKVNHRSDVMTELLTSKALLVGSPTLNNGLLPTVADFLTYAKGLKPADKITAAFGSYGWSGEAVKQINGFFEEMKLEPISPGVRHNYVPDHQVLHQCRELGQQVGRAVLAAGK